MKPLGWTAKVRMLIITLGLTRVSYTTHQKSLLVKKDFGINLLRFSVGMGLVILVLGFASPRSLWAQALLENPQPDSFQSGIGVISGFVCEAILIEIEFNGGSIFEAAYGTSRGDTQGVCGDTDNGFSLLFNWNLLGDGVHTIRALADGVEFANVTITVTTLGLGEFPTGLSGEFTLTGFPMTGDTTNIQWQQSQQNFVIASGIASGGGSSGSGERVLENPQPDSFQGGIGVISGFVCEAILIEIEFNGGSIFEAAYGTSRGDTQGVCGDTDNGFSLLFNWNLLGDGVHTIRALADGVEFANVTITVTTLGLGEFPTGLSGEFMLMDFPETGDETSIQWQQSQQNFVIVDLTGESGSPVYTGRWEGFTFQDVPAANLPISLTVNDGNVITFLEFDLRRTFHDSSTGGDVSCTYSISVMLEAPIGTDGTFSADVTVPAQEPFEYSGELSGFFIGTEGQGIFDVNESQLCCPGASPGTLICGLCDEDLGLPCSEILNFTYEVSKVS